MTFLFLSLSYSPLVAKVGDEYYCEIVKSVNFDGNGELLFGDLKEKFNFKWLENKIYIYTVPTFGQDLLVYHEFENDKNSEFSVSIGKQKIYFYDADGTLYYHFSYHSDLSNSNFLIKVAKCFKI